MIVINKLRERRATKVQDAMNNQYANMTLLNSAALLSTAKDKIGRHNETYEDAMFMACVQAVIIAESGLLEPTCIAKRAKRYTDEAMRVHNPVMVPKEE